jgi:hypothetical protein
MIESFWLGDLKQGGCQPEIYLAKEIAKVECEGHPKKNCSQNQMSAKSNYQTLYPSLTEKSSDLSEIPGSEPFFRHIPTV